MTVTKNIKYNIVISITAHYIHIFKHLFSWLLFANVLYYVAAVILVLIDIDNTNKIEKYCIGDINISYETY